MIFRTLSTTLLRILLKIIPHSKVTIKSDLDLDDIFPRNSQALMGQVKCATYIA